MPMRNSERQAVPRAAAEIPAAGLSAWEQFFFVKPLAGVYSRVRDCQGPGILERLLREMRIDLRVSEKDLTRIPRSGPALVVANHPFGILDGAVLGALLLRIRPDVRIVTNYLVAAIEELEELCIHVDPFARASSRGANIAGLRRAVNHLKAGGMLAMFPSGEVSHWHFRHGEVTDPEWNPTAARLARLAGAPVVPVLFGGRNSVRFQLMGVVHPKLRTLQLPRELLNKSGKQVGLRVGTPVSKERLRRLGNDMQATSYLRWRTYLLRRRIEDSLPRAASAPVLPERQYTDEVREAVAAEIAQLPGESALEENRDFRVFVADPNAIPYTMLEIGRQRELAFREAGEGTGKDLDLDGFDRYYKQLILWSRKDQQLAGGYRIAGTADVLPRYGVQGLYTSTLFWMDPALFDHLGPALELGRSFVRREYQKQYGALLMLWRGIARYLARHPESPVLFGPVSISGAYNQTSRELLFQFLQSQCSSPLAQWVRPRRPFKSHPVSDWELRAIRYLLDVEEMSSSIAEIEGDGKGVPVLIRHYLKIGGELLAFNVDRNFSNVLDGLILVDLRKSDPARLESYMGKEDAAKFMNYHAAQRKSPGSPEFVGPGIASVS
jgi:putative hemolysin